jgi:flagellar motor switch protein FliG
MTATTTDRHDRFASVRPTANQQLVPKRSVLQDHAAIIVMALDEDRSKRLLSQLNEEEIRRLSTAMARLGRADLQQVEEVVSEFRAEIGRSCNIVGGYHAAEKVLSSLLPPDKVAEIMDEIKGPNGKNIWEKLSHIQPQTLAGYLRNEYPQTAAVILTRLPAAHAAKIFRLLPNKLASDISLRMVRMSSIQRTVISDIEETLKREFTSVLARAYERDSTSIVADMLNRSEQDVVDRVLSSLEEKEPQVAARIRRIMFTFEDLQRIDPSTFGLLITEIPPDRLPVALASASEDLQALFMSQMSERARRMLQDEMESMLPPRRKSIEDAQSEIIGIAKRLIDEGRLVLLEQEEEEEAEA